MADDLTMRQQAALLTLMTQAREMTNTELHDLAGADLDRRDRERLATLGYLRCWKDRGSFIHDLTPSGWSWCREAFASGARPPRSGPAAGALFAVLGGLEGHLRRSALSPAEVFRPDTEARIRAVYRRLARRPGAFVRLSEIRERLVGVGDDEISETLDRMITLPDVRLIPEANRRMLTDDDRKAAVEIGGQLVHLLAIGEA